MSSSSAWKLRRVPTLNGGKKSTTKLRLAKEDIGIVGE